VFAHEPVLFALLKKEGRLPEWTEIEQVTIEAAQDVQQGHPERATERFIDYWSGAGTWERTSEERRRAFARTVAKIALDFEAIRDDPDGLAEYARLTAPTLVTAGDTGAQTGRCVAELLGRVLPQGSLRILEGAGHMAPIADAERVNAIIADHLAANPIRS
jgi:pimeloyl-ACP methyl ester carboxylesterase